MSGSYELYAEVLRRTAVKVAKEIGWELEPSRAQFVPDSVARWQPFREANAAMDRLSGRYDVGIVSNIDDKLLGDLPPPPAHRAGHRRHRPAGPLLQARRGALPRVRPPPRRQEGLGPHRLRLRRRRRALPEAEGAGDLGQPPRREARRPQEAGRGGQDLPRRRRQARRQVEPPMAPDAPPRDPADEAMVARAHERFAAERRRASRRGRRGGGAMPNLIVIGGLKCGTTSLHHYLNLHPEIAMSRPKELNFFVAELNWELGADWYRSHFDAGTARPRRDLAALHEPAPVRGRRRADARDAGRRRPRRLHGPPPDRPPALALPPQRRRRLRVPRACRGRRRPAERLRPARPLRLPARALPGGVRGRSRAGRLARGAGLATATRPSAACSSSPASTRASPRPSSTASGRPAAARARAASG